MGGRLSERRHREAAGSSDCLSRPVVARFVGRADGGTALWSHAALRAARSPPPGLGGSPRPVLLDPGRVRDLLLVCADEQRSNWTSASSARPRVSSGLDDGSDRRIEAPLDHRGGRDRGRPRRHRGGRVLHRTIPREGRSPHRAVRDSSTLAHRVAVPIAHTFAKPDGHATACTGHTILQRSGARHRRAVHAGSGRRLPTLQLSPSPVRAAGDGPARCLPDDLRVPFRAGP